KVWSALLSLVENFYPIAQLQFLWINGITLRHPDDLKILYTCKNNIKKSWLAYGNLKYCKIDGLFISEGEKWSERRKMLNPAFSQSLLQIYARIDEANANRLIQKLKCEGQVVVPDVFSMFDKLAFGIVFEAILGINWHEQASEERDELIQSVKILGEVSLSRSARPYIANWMMPFLSIGRRQKKAVQFITYFVDKVVKERRKRRENEVLSSYQDWKDDNHKEGQRRMAVLDLLFAAEEQNLIDEKGIQEEVITFIIAGYETTGASAAFTILLLAENGEIQNRARAEVDNVVNQNSGKLTTVELQKLEYLERCIKETLRIYSILPLNGRDLETDKDF
ncbi:hypothetical protein QAD02_011345, partial [Eretmocerus hayati]